MDSLFSIPDFKDLGWYDWKTDLVLEEKDIILLLEWIAFLSENNNRLNSHINYKLWSNSIKNKYLSDKSKCPSDIPEEDIDAILDFLWNEEHPAKKEFQGRLDFYKFIESLNSTREKLIDTICEFPGLEWPDDLTEHANKNEMVEFFAKNGFLSVSIENVIEICNAMQVYKWFNLRTLEEEFNVIHDYLHYVSNEWSNIIYDTSEISNKLYRVVEENFAKLGWESNYVDALPAIHEILLDDKNDEIWNLAQYRAHGDQEYALLLYVHLRMKSQPSKTT